MSAIHTDHTTEITVFLSVPVISLKFICFVFISKYASVSLKWICVPFMMQKVGLPVV